MIRDFLENITYSIRRWSGVEAPNQESLLMVEDLNKLIDEVEGVRDFGCFDDEPGDFELALQACKEGEQ